MDTSIEKIIGWLKKDKTMNSFSIVDTFVKTAISYTPVLSGVDGLETLTFAWLGESYTTLPPLVAKKSNLNPRRRG